ncbi:MAG TPA: hypothetical protein DEP66_00075 [Acidimicrobiaceae bacterium]|nr:hypothetical protein [Acidimicrobiaceae bacterium]HCB36646.1 hypothetical protein [Acidimicrobiaceae bacterium]
MPKSDLDPRTPVLAGVGQFIQRPDDPLDALEPLAMMAEAVEAAARDATGRTGDGAALAPAARATHIWVVKGAWPYTDPAALLAQRFGADCRTGLSGDGGNTPQSLVNKACLAIAAGDAEVVVIVGAEGIWSRRRARRGGLRIPYTDQPDATPDVFLGDALGDDVVMSHPVELERGLSLPVNLYPLFESAYRHARGESVEAHRDRVAALWERFNEVAVANPYSWVRTPMTAAEIREPGPHNRLVGFPYTKAMNSNWDLDQAAALILCSAAAADAAGVPHDRWVFPHAGTDGHDTWYVSNRGDLHSSPAIRVAGRHALELAGVGPDDLDHVDLYSCFPSAVQIAADELGLGHDRPLTVTGGLTFAGGPLNNYVTHSIATMAGVLRDSPGAVGLCSANGGYLTKHAFGVYSTDPPAAGGFRHRDCQEEIDRFPSVELAADHTGPATLEAYTVMHDADGPEVALAAVRVAGADGTDAGPRQWATSRDPQLMDRLLVGEHVGHAVEVTADFEFAPA